MANTYLDNNSLYEIDFNTNDILLTVGDAVNSIYCFKSGCIKLERYVEEEKEVITSFSSERVISARPPCLNNVYNVSHNKQL